MNHFYKNSSYWEEWLSDITTKEDKRLLLQELSEKLKAPEELIRKVAAYCDQTSDDSRSELAKELFNFSHGIKE